VHIAAAGSRTNHVGRRPWWIIFTDGHAPHSRPSHSRTHSCFQQNGSWSAADTQIVPTTTRAAVALQAGQPLNDIVSSIKKIESPQAAHYKQNRPCNGRYRKVRQVRKVRSPLRSDFGGLIKNLPPPVPHPQPNQPLPPQRSDLKLAPPIPDRR
jgi:hypothetical protein